MDARVYIFIIYTADWQVVKDVNFEFLKLFLDKFTIDFPTGRECQACHIVDLND